MSHHSLRFFATLGTACAAVLFAVSRASATPVPKRLAPDGNMPPAGGSDQVAVFSGGCFWGVQAVFQHTKGVTSAVSGYAGGEQTKANYDRVSDGNTGHAESVRVTFDPSQISYGQLLQVFFGIAHDPTQLNYQGPDHGTQYRSAIWYTTPEQKVEVERYVAQLTREKVFSRPIVTQIAALPAFYSAEEYHQDYATRHPRQPYIVINDAPKVERFRKTLPALYREKPVLVGDVRP
jgi:peptide-methionine (S)-S-oxide reductase